MGYKITDSIYIGGPYAGRYVNPKARLHAEYEKMELILNPEPGKIYLIPTEYVYVWQDIHPEHMLDYILDRCRAADRNESAPPSEWE